MSESVIIATITGVLAVLGSFVGNVAISAKKAREEAIKDAEREQAQKDQLGMILDEQQSIKRRLDEHNHYAEKFAENSKNLAVIQERQENIRKAVDKLQKDIDYLKSDRCQV